MKRFLWSAATLLFPVAVLAGCNDKIPEKPEEVPDTTTDKVELKLSPLNLNFEAGGDTKEVVITLTGENVNIENVTIAVSDKGTGWVVAEVIDGKVCVNVSPQPDESTRSASVSVTYDNITRSVSIYQKAGTGFDYSAIFADEVQGSLQPGVTEADINTIPVPIYKSLALRLLDENYDTKFRVAEFRPYQHPDEMATFNRIPHAYSLRDNPTGIYVDQGDEFYVLLGDNKGQNISLVLQNLTMGWGSSVTFTLAKGLNKFKATMPGLLYVMNHTKEPVPLILETDEEKAAAAARTVNIHFIDGKVQGYYRKGETTLDEWKAMVAAAKYNEIDVVGDYFHLTWLTSEYKSTPGNVETIAGKIDGLVWQQQELGGLVKYNKMFRNRMYLMHINSGNPNATKYRTNYTPGYGEIFSKPDRYLARLWVLGHEIGHINQVGIRWAGTIEVSNNIFAMYNQQKELGRAERLTTASFSNERELRLPGATQSTKYPDIYQTAIAAFVTAENPLGINLDWYKPEDDQNENLEHWLRLVPFWQLQLYLADALGKTDFYPDLFEDYRTRIPIPTNLSHGAQQLLFVEMCCKAANLDLTEFFEKWGFLRPINRMIKDYGDKDMTITQSQIDATKAKIAAAGYPAPPHTADQIITIRDTNVAQFKQ